MPKYWIKFHTNYTNYLDVNFLAVAETIVGLLLCYGVMIVQCPSISCIRDFKTLFTWTGGPRSSGVGFFCFVSPRA